ncbi:MAG: signal peptide peptidase SppA [Verrucomicrobia bacterium]|jgi:protease-4|nr:MAG: signal peptide peptidase SppA [Verrucomicrobiota bacterium]
MESNTPPIPGTPTPFQIPPPIITPPQPTRQPRRWGWIIISSILFLFLVLSVLINIGNAFRGMGNVSGTHHHGGPRLDEVVVEDHKGSDKIAVVPIEGVITSHSSDRGGYNMVEVVKAQLKRADEDEDVKAVILRVDSPGGEVLASDDIANAIRNFQEDSTKPVIVSMGSLAASGGYYVSAPCEWIVANELTITGSIGVIMHGYNYRGLMDKIGLRPDVYKSGKFKDMLSGDRLQAEIPQEERAMVQKLIDETYSKFKDVVGEGRKAAHDINKDGRALVSDWASYADGRVFSGKEAKELGFVDELGGFDVAVSRAEKIAKIKGSASIIEYRQRVDFADLFGILGKSEAPVVKVDIGMDAPKLEGGRMYFITSTFLR